MQEAISPLAPKNPPLLPAIPGARLATAAAEIRYRGRDDVMLALFDEGTTVAGVFTRSKCPSAPVEWCRANLTKGPRARALIVNSGNANAFTGQIGQRTVQRTAQAVATAVGCPWEEVFIASTGVIGEPLDAAKLEGVIDTCVLQAAPEHWRQAAAAIRTTDTYSKTATRCVEMGGIPITINGIAKGSGMIAPDMATLLSFIVTDAPIAPALSQILLAQGAQKSFNKITVEGDTSTSDTLLLFSTGAAEHRGVSLLEDLEDIRLAYFRDALDEVLLDLAHQVVRDGEGATKFVTVTVTNATDERAATRIARSIAQSPLVKTAIAGEDGNWGRVVMAIGKAGEVADRDRLAIWFGDIRVAVGGGRDPDYDEQTLAAYMKGQEIVIHVDIGLGTENSTIWTCDMTREYFEINCDYRS